MKAKPIECSECGRVGMIEEIPECLCCHDFHCFGCYCELFARYLDAFENDPEESEPGE